LQEPIRSGFQISTSATGEIRHTHVVITENQNSRNVYQQQTNAASGALAVPLFYGRGQRAIVDSQANALGREREIELVIERQLLERRAYQELASTQARAAWTEQSVAAQNDVIRKRKERVDFVLRSSLGELQGRSPEDWWQYWEDYNELERRQKPEYAHGNISHYKYAQDYCAPEIVGVIPSCFVAGTPVWTEIGVRPIDEIQIGDRVLAPDVLSGELAWKPVVYRTVRAPSPIIHLQLPDETISATRGHSFWVDGRGWTMAKFLEPRNQLHSFRGGLELVAVQMAEQTEAYNLVVEDFHTYFVGRAGLIVHDTLLCDAPPVLTPGLPRDEERFVTTQQPASLTSVELPS
jgi:hypothetical protein